METSKKCVTCKITKNKSEFGKKYREKDGLQYSCKKCFNKEITEYYKTENGLIARIYGSQVTNSKRRKHSCPKYSQEELKQWLLNKKKFHKLYAIWVTSSYDTNLKPSVDRLDDSRGYSFDNIQLMTWAENKAKGHLDMRNGKLINGKNPQKAVLQYSKDGRLVAEFVSANNASRQTGIKQPNISRSCNSKSILTSIDKL